MARGPAWRSVGLVAIGTRFRLVLRLFGVEVTTPATGPGSASEVPRDGGVVFMWKQESHLDHLHLPPVMPRPFFSLFNNAVMRKPLYGSYLRRHTLEEQVTETFRRLRGQGPLP